MSWHADNWWWVATGLLLVATGGVAGCRRPALALVILAAALVAVGLGGVHFVHTKALLVTDSGGAGGQPWRDEAWLTALQRAWLSPGAAVEHRDWPLQGNQPLPKEAWLVTDGMRQLGDVAAYTLVPPQGIDAAVRELSVKPAGNDVELATQIGWYGSKGDVKVTITRGDTEVTRQRLTFEGNGQRWLTFREPAPKGACEYVVQVRTPGDGWPQNDEARAWYVPETPGRVLEWKAGTHDPVAAGWQAVVVKDEINSEDAKTLDDFVRNSGGGLVLVGKVPAGLEELAPVSPRREEGGGRTVVFVLDASASMNESTPAGERKLSVLAQAVESASGMLAAGDRVVVVTFNGGARKVADGTRRDVALALNRLSAEGPTLPDAALPLVEESLQGDAREKWVVLVTDGQVERAALSVAKWREALGETELLVVAPSDAGVIGELVLGVQRGVYLKADEAAAWGRVLRNQFSRRVTGTWRSGELAWKGAGEMAGMHGTARGWREVWKKPAGVAWAEAHEGEVVAAVVQRGLGRVAFVGVEDAALQNRAAELVLAAAGDRRFRVSTKHVEEGWRVRAEGIEDGRFLDGERLELRSEGRVLTMEQVGPGAYEGLVTAAGSLRGTVVRQTEKGEALVGRVVTRTLATGPWPATVGRVHLPGSGVELPPENKEGARWEPPGGERVEVGWTLWMAAALVGVVAVCRR